MNIVNESFLEQIDGKNLNFLFGAGASLPAVKTLAILDGEKQTSIEKLFEEYRDDEVAQACLKLLFFKRSVKKGFITAKDIEKNEHKNNEKTDDITKSVKNYTDFVDILMTLLNHNGFERAKRANIFTTNYDTLIETAFDKVSLRHPLAYFNDGSRGFFRKEISYENYYFNISHSGTMDAYRREIPSINLYKLHGSLSWIKESNCEDSIIITTNKNDVLEEINQIIEKYLKNNFDFNKVEVTKKDIEKEISSIKDEKKNELLNFQQKYDQLMIVNPTKQKFQETVFQKQYYQLLREFENELQKPDSVLIAFGFSFRDEHIVELIRRSLTNPSLQLFVVPYNKADIDFTNSTFLGYQEIAFLTTPKKSNELKAYDQREMSSEEPKASDSNENGTFDIFNGFLAGNLEIEQKK